MTEAPRLGQVLPGAKLDVAAVEPAGLHHLVELAPGRPVEQVAVHPAELGPGRPVEPVTVHPAEPERQASAALPV